jgi:hypothetical protein
MHERTTHLYKSERGTYRDFAHVGQVAALSAHPPVLTYMKGCMTRILASIGATLIAQ